MPLPLTRNTTYSPASPVLSADLNAIQDCIIGGKHGPRKMLLAPFAGAGDYTVGALTIPYVISTGANVWKWGLPLHEGDRIVSLAFWRFGDASVDISDADWLKSTGAGLAAPTLVSNINVSNVAAAWTLSTFAVVNQTLAAGECHWLAVRSDAANLRLGFVEITYDRP